MKKIYTSDVFNLTKNFLAIPPLLFATYAATKTINNDINIEYFDKAINLLTSDLTNSATLGALIAGTYLITKKEKLTRVLGLSTMIGGSIGLMSAAVSNNNLEPFFLSQNLILNYLTVKTIINELKNKDDVKESNIENKSYLNNEKISKFLSSKKEAIKNGLKNFHEDFCKTIEKNKNNSILLSGSFLLLSTYMLSKTNIDINIMKDNINTICEKGYNFTAMALSLYGSYKLSKNEPLKTGVSWTISNAMWFMNANSNLHELSTVLFLYTSSLLVYNSSKDLEEKQKLLSLNEYIDKPFEKFKNSINKLIKQPILKEKEKE